MIAVHDDVAHRTVRVSDDVDGPGTRPDVVADGRRILDVMDMVVADRDVGRALADDDAVRPFGAVVGNQVAELEALQRDVADLADPDECQTAAPGYLLAVDNRRFTLVGP